MVQSTSRGKAQEWQRRLRRFRKSRQSVAAFCRQEGVSPPSFYLWKKRLALSAQPASAAVGLPSGFRPVRLLPAAAVQVQLPGGTQLVVPLSDAEGLRVVVETVARVRFVSFMTAMSLLSYGVLVVDFSFWRPDLQHNFDASAARHVLYAVSLLVLGAIVSSLVQRLRMLSKFYGRQLP